MPAGESIDAWQEIRGLLADHLLWWAFRLDPERFIAIDQHGRQVVEVTTKES